MVAPQDLDLADIVLLLVAEEVDLLQQLLLVVLELPHGAAAASVVGGRKLIDEATSDESVGLRIYIEAYNMDLDLHNEASTADMHVLRLRQELL